MRQNSVQGLTLFDIYISDDPIKQDEQLTGNVNTTAYYATIHNEYYCIYQKKVDQHIEFFQRVEFI